MRVLRREAARCQNDLKRLPYSSPAYHATDYHQVDCCNCALEIEQKLKDDE